MSKTLRAGVLATVIVVSVLLLSLLAGLMWLWEADFLLFSRTDYLLRQRANIESAYTLYRIDPGIMERLTADSTLQLYDSLPSSRMKLSRMPWGLYETVSVASADGRIHSVRLMAATETGGTTFWYKDNNGALTLSGRTNIKGRASLPRNGVIYGQMQSVFFSGEKLLPADISRSETAMPGPSKTARDVIGAIFGLRGEELLTDSLHVNFYCTPTTVAYLGSVSLEGCRLSGNIIVVAEKLHIGASCTMTDIIVAARSVVIADGFRGRLQVFAADSVSVGENVTLQSPSGLFSGLYAQVGEGSEVNGYVIIDPSGVPRAPVNPDRPDVKRPNMRTTRTSRLRGLLYVDGIAALQGIVTGSAIIGEAVYYSPQGYYRHMLYDASVLQSDAVHYPLWLDAAKGRKETVWVD